MVLIVLIVLMVLMVLMVFNVNIVVFLWFKGKGKKKKNFLGPSFSYGSLLRRVLDYYGSGNGLS